MSVSVNIWAKLKDSTIDRCYLPGAKVVLYRQRVINSNPPKFKYEKVEEFRTNNVGKVNITLLDENSPHLVTIEHNCASQNGSSLLVPKLLKEQNIQDVTILLQSNYTCDESDCYIAPDLNEHQDVFTNTGVGAGDDTDIYMGSGTHTGGHSGSQQNTGAGTGTETGSGAGQGQGTGNNTGTGGTRPPGTGGIKRTIMKFRIIDQKTKEPLPGAEVYNHGTNQGAVTDIDGYVSIAAKAGDLIEIRFMGYQTQKLPAEQVPKILEMAESAETLDTVTVTLQKRHKRLLWVLGGSLGLYLLFGRNEKGMNGPDEPVEVDL